jgi:hypothetical protein
MATQKPKFRHSVDQFGLCVFLHLIFPLLPIGFERVLKHHVSTSALMLALAMYAFALANTTKSGTCFGLFIVIGFFSGALYGFAEAQSLTEDVVRFAWFTLLFIFVAHAIERFRRHVVQGEKFLEFGRDEQH